MVKAKEKFIYASDGTLDINAWLEKIQAQYELKEREINCLRKACAVTQTLTQGLTTFYGQPYLEHGLEMAEILFDLKLDQDTIVAGMIANISPLSKTAHELIKKELGETVAQLAAGVQQIDITPMLQHQQMSRSKSQIDKIRKMLLAMATDICMVIIKLAERLCLLRGIKAIPIAEQKRIAQEVTDIYAPLANRLGIAQLKWELEDLALRYQDPVAYKTIASLLSERRVDREKRIQTLIAFLHKNLTAANIHADITGRAKHIYSIYAKMNRKEKTYQDIYDRAAVRILVTNVEDCYAALSVVHSLWAPIIKEFNDYIANSKPNGYRSIHTAVIGDDNNHFEIQIRTHTMHEEAERGVAAHWAYKENKTLASGNNNAANDPSKMDYLRQLLDWHREIEGDAHTTASPLLDNQIYVTTPADDIIDLPLHATPLDFAYTIHTGLGHRCRGAKVNGQIVPLSQALRTGDKVEIITILQGNPSRDWLNPELGYIKTSQARNKIAHWFKQQAFNNDVLAGKQLLERELAKLGLSKTVSLNTLAQQFNLKDEDNLCAALNRGSIRLAHILHAIQPKPAEKVAAPQTMLTSSKPHTMTVRSAIAGSEDLLTRFAKCCKPIPGDAITGYITQGRGLSIHKKNCSNIHHLIHPERFLAIEWEQQATNFFSTDLKIVAQEEEKVFSDLTALFANEKIDLISFHTTFNKNQNKIYITATIQIQNSAQLERQLHRIQQLPSVIEVMRVSS